MNLPENSYPLKIYEATTDFSELVQYICEQMNLHAAQSGREFVTNPEEFHAFLGTNFVMSISKLPNLKCYWSVGSYFYNEGVRNAITRDRFMRIVAVIRHLNKAFQAAMADGER